MQVTRMHCQTTHKLYFKPKRHPSNADESTHQVKQTMRKMIVFVIGISCGFAYQSEL